MEILVYSTNKSVPAYDLCRYYGVRRVEDVPQARERLKRVAIWLPELQSAVYADWEATVGRSIPSSRVGRSSLKSQQWEREEQLVWQGDLPDILTQENPAPAEAPWLQNLVDQYMINGDDFPLGEVLKYAKKAGILNKLQFRRELYTKHLHNAIKCVEVLKQYGLFK